MNIITSRAFWLVFAGITLVFELFGYFWLQLYLGLFPCVYCVYIRFALIVILLSCIYIALTPRLLWVRYTGYIGIIYGSIQGLIWSYQYYAIVHSPIQKNTAYCSSIPEFPLGIPLHYWFPDFFYPTATCIEQPWALFGLPLETLLLIAFVSSTILCISIVLLDTYYSIIKRYQI